MRILASSLVLVLCATAASAQPPMTQTATFPSAGSQANSATASLNVSAVVQAPGELPSPLVIALGPGNLSTTLAYTTFGSTTFPTPGSISLAGTLNGTPNAPFALAVSIMPGGTFCGGFAGWPCMTGPILFGTTLTPWGLYHLDATPIMLLDGIASSAPPAFLDGAGSFPLAATAVLDTMSNGGFEYNFAIQALIADPTAANGFTFTACLTGNQWVFYL